MLKVILAKIGISLFRYLPLEQIVAKIDSGAATRAAEKIKAGELTVHDYMSDDSCPAASF